MELITAYAWIGWLVLILIFITVEILTLDFVFLMIAAGSVGGLIAELLGVPWWWQLAIAAVLSVLLLFTLRPPLLRALHRGGDPARSNIDALIGIHGRVVRTVAGSGGQAKLANGETWTARLSEAADRTQLDPGERVVVIAIDGATAVVIPAKGHGEP